MTIEEDMLKELQSIRRLQILMLIKSGATSEEIGEALGLSSSAVRKMFSMRKVRKARGE
jgi:DNA-binding NarL/FixJ family response regulator